MVTRARPLSLLPLHLHPHFSLPLAPLTSLALLPAAIPLLQSTPSVCDRQTALLQTPTEWQVVCSRGVTEAMTESLASVMGIEGMRFGGCTRRDRNFCCRF